MCRGIMQTSSPSLPLSLPLSLSLSFFLSYSLFLPLALSLYISVLLGVLNTLFPSPLHSSSRSSRARLIQAVTLLSWLELSTLRSASVPGANTTTWTMSAKILTITPSLRCSATGALETSLRYVHVVGWCNLVLHLGGVGGNCGKLSATIIYICSRLLQCPPPSICKLSPYDIIQVKMILLTKLCLLTWLLVCNGFYHPWWDIFSVL